MRIVPLIEVELDCAPGSAVDYRELCSLPESAVCTGAVLELMLVSAREAHEGIPAPIVLRDVVLSGHAPIGDGLRLLGRAFDTTIEVIGATLPNARPWLRTDAFAVLVRGEQAERAVSGLPVARATLEDDSQFVQHARARAGGALAGGWIRRALRDAARRHVLLEVDAHGLQDVGSYTLHPMLWEAGIAIAEALLNHGDPARLDRQLSIRARSLSVCAPGEGPLRIEIELLEDHVTIRWIGEGGALIADANGLTVGQARCDEPGVWRTARIVERTLGKRVDDAQQRFAELGVSSIDRARVAAALALDFGCKPQLEAILSCETLGDVARLFASESGHDDVPPAAPAIYPAARFALSAAQRQVWALQAMAPDVPRCHLHLRLRCTGPLDNGALRAALDALLARHASLRTVFDCAQDEPLQRVLPAFSPALAPIDLTHVAEPEVQRQLLLRESDKHVRAAFDLERGPLIRFALVKLSEAVHALLISAHHLIVDGFGIELLVRELLALYENPDAFGGEQLGLERIAEPYAARTAPVAVSGAFPARDAARRLPLARDPDGSGAGHGARAGIELDPDLREVAQRAQISSFSLLCAAYGYVLAQHAAQDAIVIGVVSAARSTLDQLDTVGMFARSVPLRIAIDRDVSLLAIAREIHARVPSLASEPSDTTDSTPFAVTALYQQWSSAPLTAGPLTFLLELDSPDGAPLGYCRSELELLAMDSGTEITAWLQYDRSIFNATTVTWLANALRNVLGEAVACGERALRDSPTEQPGRGLVLHGPQLAIDQPFVHRRIAAQALERPDAIAIRDGHGGELTFRALVERARAIGLALRERGARPGQFVGIIAERVADLPLAVLGVLESGAAYVPIDPEHPPERIELALADAGVELVIALGPSELVFSRAQIIALDGLVGQGLRLPPVEIALSPSDAAYVLHTSGSTGAPKGVIVEHHNLGNFVRAMEALLPIAPRGPWLALTTLAFDISIVELLFALAIGAEVRVGSAPSLKSNESDPFAVLRELGEGTQCFQCTPSLARLMLQDTDGRAFLGRLAVLLVGGEALPLWLARALCELVPGTVFNMYGPTETTVWSTAARVEPDAAWVPIGLPLANTTLRIVDDQGRDVANGLSGELWIGGAGVARGYMMRPDETTARFVGDEGAWCYRTGDLVRARELSGSRVALEWLGRIDRQIKLAGNRIELGEIEGVIAQHPFARDCAVLTELSAGEERLVAVVVPDDASMADAGTNNGVVTGIYSADEIEAVLLAWASQRLPQYMVPARTVLVDALPQTASGKTDRQRLVELVARRRPADALRLGERPVTREEKLLAELWSEVLARPDVGRYDDFFALGGTSFAAVLLASRARKRGVMLAPAVVLAHPTLAEQALQISAVVVQREARALQEEARLEPLRIAGSAAQWPPRRIVLTGATGFLGAHLLAELHASLDAEIVCLVRAEDDDAARDRLHRSAVEWGLVDRIQWSLTRCVAADLKLPRFGLSEADWRFLTEHSDLVLHNAAEVNFALAYEELRATNVSGTRTALALAAEGVQKPFHYVSTIAITDASKTGERVDEESSLAYSERLVDGYSQSKWVAESIVRLAGAQGLDVTCYRAGPLIAERAPKGDAFAEALATVARTGIAFSTDGRVIPHLSRVDDTSRAIVMLCLSRKRGTQIEHVVSPQRVPIADLLSWMREWGFEVNELSDAEWLERIDAEPWAAATMFVVSQRLRDGLPLVPEVEHGATLVRLSALGFTWREIDGVLIQRLIARLTSTTQNIRPSEVG